MPPYVPAEGGGGGGGGGGGAGGYIECKLPANWFKCEPSLLDRLKHLIYDSVPAFSVLR